MLLPVFFKVNDINFYGMQFRVKFKLIFAYRVKVSYRWEPTFEVEVSHLKMSPDEAVVFVAAR